MEHMGLLDREEWTPSHCTKCGHTGANHSELECPMYEQCHKCGSTGAFKFLSKHQCCEDEENNYLFTDAEEDVQWNDNSVSGMFD